MMVIRSFVITTKINKSEFKTLKMLTDMFSIVNTKLRTLYQIKN